MSRKTTPAVEAAIAKAVDYETSLADVVRRSERRAWRVAAAASLLACLLGGGYFFVLPLKESVPFLVMADVNSGTSTVAKLVQDSGSAGITTSEAVNRSNVAHFLLARESWDLALIELRDWTTVHTMAAPDVAAAYTALHANTNPQSPYNTYGAEQAVRIKILSITLVGGKPGVRAPSGATVRFQRLLLDKASGATRRLDNRIATLVFTYKPNLAMEEKVRLENPLGFQVTAYRVDLEYGDAEAPSGGETTPAAMRPVPASPREATNGAAGFAAGAAADSRIDADGMQAATQQAAGANDAAHASAATGAENAR